MKNLAHLLPILDSSGLTRDETSPPSLQLVASNEFLDTTPVFAQTDVSVSHVPIDRFQEGYDTGYAIGLAQGRSQVMAEHAGQSVAMEAFVATARAQWTEDQSQRIADGIAKALQVIQDEISTCVEICLRDLLQDNMRAQALTEFSSRVRELCTLGDAAIVTVHAPTDLVKSLRERLHNFPSIEFQTSETAQVWVRSGATLIEARLAPWFSALSQVE